MAREQKELTNMSETDPYAPSDAPVTEEAKFTPEPAVTIEETSAVTPLDAPVSEELAVPEGSVKKVLDWVGEDVTRAKAALEVEKDGDKRSSLIQKLEAIVN